MGDQKDDAELHQIMVGREYCPRCGSGPRQASDVKECPDCGRRWDGPPLICDAIPDKTIDQDPPLGCWVDAARAVIAKANGCPTCGADLRGSFPKCNACQLVDALKDGQ